MNRFVNYVTYIVLLLTSVFYSSVLDQTGSFAFKPSTEEFTQQSQKLSKHLSLHLFNFKITGVNQAARFDRSIRQLDGLDPYVDDVGRYMPRLQVQPGHFTFARVHHWWDFGNYANSDIAQVFVIGMFSIVTVDHEGEPGALVVGRGTFVGVPFVVFAYKGEIVHVTTSNDEALDYFIEHWQ